MRRTVSACFLVLSSLIPAAPVLAAEEAVIEAMRDYMEFAPYAAGIILTGQLDRTVFESVVFIDARDARQYAAGSIPGAVNIEWREVLARRNEIPRDRKVVMFCNTGSLSAQATFALRVAGFENVVVLQDGLEGWLRDAPYRP